MSDYLIDRDRRRAKDRLTRKEHFQDRASIDYLEQLGVAPGWRCLEVGAGAGSIAQWLADRVGEDGYVLATDIDTSLLEDIDLPCLEIRQHDIAVDPLPEGEFDLIHARDVLVHLPTREELLAKFLSALKPGGWMLLEEPDVSVDVAERNAGRAQWKLYDKITRAIFRYLTDRGLDPYFGSRLYRLMHELGLTELGAEARVQLFSGGPGEGRSHHMSAFEELSEEVIEDGGFSRDEFDLFCRLSQDETFAWREGFTVSVWGQRPPTRPASQ